MGVLNSATIEGYFSHLVSTLSARREVCAVVVAHMVPNTLAFVPALDRIVKVAAILPKPKSVGSQEHEQLASKYKCVDLSREWASNSSRVIDTFKSLGLSHKEVVIVDIGGYFAGVADDVAREFKLRGILEGTENGIKRYESRLPCGVPVLTVARSPLKLPEDYLVASSVVFSIEAILREESEILQTRSAAVLGYGRVGSALADILRGRGINTVVYDDDPVQLAKAAARGFHAHRKIDNALSLSSLVVCATGNRALDLPRFAMLRNGCVVASVTSADDELDLLALRGKYRQTPLSKNIARYDENRRGGKHFLLIAGGNAANFVHGAVIGPSIQLIEGEKLVGVAKLANERVLPSDTYHEVSQADRQSVAGIWNQHFLT